MTTEEIVNRVEEACRQFFYEIHDAITGDMSQEELLRLRRQLHERLTNMLEEGKPWIALKAFEHVIYRLDGHIAAVAAEAALDIFGPDIFDANIPLKGHTEEQHS
jgi:hypothetical protein